MKSSGGPWGAIFVDDAYLKVLKEIYGSALDAVKVVESDYIDILRAFELKKMMFTGKGGDWITVQIPASLYVCFKKKSKKSLEKKIKTCGFVNKVQNTSCLDKIRIKKSFVQEWFDGPTDSLITHLKKNILSSKEIESVNSVLLVGGFSESEYVREKLKTELELQGKSIICPSEPCSVVLKGAVQYGHNPRIIHSRIMRHSYGLDSHAYFDENLHESSRCIMFHGKKMVQHEFLCFVSANERVCFGQEFTKPYYPLQASQPTTEIAIFRSPRPRPRYTTDDGCEKIGKLKVSHPMGTSKEDKKMSVTLIFGDTELKVKTTLAKTGEEFNLKIHCLE